jgi:competence protein ComEA
LTLHKMKNPIFSFIKDFFDFSQKEMNGFVVMSAIMVVVILSTIGYDHFSVKEIVLDPKETQTLDSLLAFIDSNKAEYQTYRKQPFEPYAKIENEVKLFVFNPNTISENEMISLGLKPYLAERIVKYRSKGGKFKIKSDLKKIFGFPEDKYLQIESYIDLPESKIVEAQSEENSSNKFESKYPQKFPDKPIKTFAKQNINLADSVALEKVYGIGSSLLQELLNTGISWAVLFLLIN